MAEGYLQRLADTGGVDVEARSAGVAAMEGAPPSPSAVEVARRSGVDISALRSAPLTEELLEWADLVVPMTVSHESAVCSISPDAAGKTRRLGEFSSGRDIRDPFGGSVKEYQACFDEMKVALDNMFDKMKRKELPQ